MAASSFRLDKRNAKLMGVCAGLADATGVDALLVRVGWLVLTLGWLHGWGVALYLIVALVARGR